MFEMAYAVVAAAARAESVMSRMLRIVIAASLVAAPAAAPSRQQEARQLIPTPAELRQCPDLARANWGKVSRDLARAARENAPSNYHVDDEHRRIRGPRPMPDVSRAGIVIDVAIGSG